MAQETKTVGDELTGESFVGFGKTDAGKTGTGETFRAVNPASNEPLPTAFIEATNKDIERAMTLARAAFTSFRRSAARDKAAFLNRIAAGLRADADAIIRTADEETALGEGRLTGELERTAGQLEEFARVVEDGAWCDARIERGREGKADLRRMLTALGPVVVFGSSNFPLAFSVAGGDTASALAAGCPVVVKGHPAHPATSERVARVVLAAARENGLPDGVFSLLQSSRPETSVALVTHPETAAVGFTGSGRVGRILYDAAATRPVPIPVFCEMGSTNPVFVFPGALENAGALAAGLAGSLTLGAGQFCTNPGVTVLVESPEAQTFAETLAQEVASGAPATMLTPGIFGAYRAGLEALLGTEGVDLMGEPLQHDARGNRGAHAVLSTDAATFLNTETLHEEVFGPVTLLIFCKNEAERLEVARNLHGHLTASLHASEAELSDQKELLSVLSDKVGRLIFNGFPTGVAVNHAMQHGGPYPATTDPRFTSVGSAAMLRFAKPVCYQDCPDALLPPELQRANPLGLWRLVDGDRTRAAQA